MKKLPKVEPDTRTKCPSCGNLYVVFDAWRCATCGHCFDAPPPREIRSWVTSLAFVALGLVVGGLEFNRFKTAKVGTSGDPQVSAQSDQKDLLYSAAANWIKISRWDKAVPLLEDAAELGHLQAVCDLGNAYYLGRGLMQNYELAVAQFQKAAHRGYAEAQYMLGVCYRAGQGVPQDYARAYAWFNLASARLHPLASQARQELVNSLTPEVIALGQKISLRLDEELKQLTSPLATGK